MEEVDKKIFTAEIAKRMCEVVNAMVVKYGISEPLSISAVSDTPDAYADANGNIKTGRLLTVHVDFLEDDDDEE